MQGCFQPVGLLPELTVAGVADGGRFKVSSVILLQNAAKGCGGVDLGMGSESLRLEFFQEALALVFKPNARFRTG